MGKLADEFLAPPFSVLDAKQPYWQNRLEYWKSEYNLSTLVGRGESRTRNSYSDTAKEAANGSETSVFDPVLCELMYRWFMPTKGREIFDPFSGGPERGIVAADLGYEYFGVDVRQEQVKANRNARSIHSSKFEYTPKWAVGDSSDLSNVSVPQSDLIFSCPPYHNLEVYSDRDADISNKNWKEFLDAYSDCIENCHDNLKDNRFAAFLVQEIRGSDGQQKSLIPKTIEKFEAAGFAYYNNLVYIPMYGSLPIRARLLFNSNRKVGRAHQNLLVFYKGDLSKIGENYAKLDFTGENGEQKDLNSF